MGEGQRVIPVESDNSRLNVAVPFGLRAWFDCIALETVYTLLQRRNIHVNAPTEQNHVYIRSDHLSHWGRSGLVVSKLVSGARGSRFESRCGQFVFSRKPLRYAALGTGSKVPRVRRLTRPTIHRGTVNWVSAFCRSNNVNDIGWIFGRLQPTSWLIG